MAQVNTLSATSAHQNSRQPASAPQPPRRGAVLVIEDRDDVRDGMAQLLELHGFVVVDAADAEQALAHLHADPRGFALILLDLMLPGAIDGPALRERQLGHPELRDIPTIVVSASLPDPQQRDTLLEDAWISKPYRFDELLVLVKRYVTPEAGALVTDG